MHYYAIHIPHHIGMFEAPSLMRFETREERDAWCARFDCTHLAGSVCKPVTLASVKHIFDVRKFDNDPFGDFSGEVKGARTIHNRVVPYIEPRRSYMTGLYNTSKHN